MQLRRFNDHGIAAFAEYLDALRKDHTLPPPFELLESPTATEELAEPIEAQPQAFVDRMAFTRWLHDAASASNARVPIRDPGFWAWLTLLLFDQVCPVTRGGKRALKEHPRYIPLLNETRRYYRHALLGPYLVFKQYEHEPEHAAALLCGSLDKLTDEAYRLFVENQLIAYPCAVALLSNLYFDKDKRKLRRGSQTKKRGAIRRFVRVLFQYSRTYDLDVLPEDSLRQMLPPEFRPWMQHRELYDAAQATR